MIKNEKHQLCPYYESKCDDQKCFCLKYQAYKDIQDPEIIKQELIELGIDPNADSWTKIMSMQKKFAARFSQVDNPSKEITDQWNKEYLICIEDEVEELVDYIGMFNQEPVLTSYKGLKKEIIDILHFIMDTFITGNCSPDILMNLHLNKHGNVLATNDNFKFAFDQAKLRLASRYKDLTINQVKIENDNLSNIELMWNINKEQMNEILLQLTLELLFINKKVREQISWKHWKKPNKSINYDNLYNVYEEMFTKFIELAAFVFQDSDDIIQSYVLKNIENIRRQKLGY